MKNKRLWQNDQMVLKLKSQIFVHHMEFIFNNQKWSIEWILLLKIYKITQTLKLKWKHNNKH